MSDRHSSRTRLAGAQRPLSIVHLDSHLPWRGGEQQVLYLTQYLHQQGQTSVVLCPPYSALYQRVQAAGVPVKALPMRHELDIVAAWQLGRYLRRQRVDVLHMHSPHAHTLGLLACALAPGVRKVVSRRVDFAPLRNLLSRWKYRRADIYYLTVSEAVRHVLLDSGIAAQRVQTVHSGIDLQRFQQLADSPPLFPPGTRVIGTVGHLAGHKGHRSLLEAMALLVRDMPHLGLAIVGDGDLRGALETMAADLGIQANVCFTGFRPDVLALIQGFEIFVFSSYLEGLGTSLLDAMALRKPIVATRAGGIPEAVHDGVNGLLVPPRDPPALAAAIRTLLQHPEQGRAFGAAGRQLVEQHFTMEHMASQTLQVYYRLLAEDAA